MNSLVVPFLTCIIGLFFVSFLIFNIKRKEEDEKARQIGLLIRKGAAAFLKKEYTILSFFVLLIFLLLVLSPIGIKTGISFVLGAVFSALSGYLGMKVATIANSKTSSAAKKSIHSALVLSFSSGTVMSFSVVCLGLFGISILYLLFKDPTIIYGFGFGASLVALFSRVGGGIYTKAADVGADLVGKVEKGIPEDDPRNPAVIADNVGDNVGDVAGMGADLFESYVDSIITAMVLGSLAVKLAQEKIILPLIISSLGIIVSLLGYLVVRFLKKGSLHQVLNRGLWVASLLMVILSFFTLKIWFKSSLNVFLPLVLGLISGVLIGAITEYYTSSEKKPSQEVAKNSQTGAATNIISGLSLGMISTLLPVIIVSLVTIFAYEVAGFYGIAIAAVGMLSTLGISLATDVSGAISDNAAGIASMAGLGAETRERCEKLDAVGNTTAAIGKGFAIGSAALTALVLVMSYTQVAKINILNILDPRTTVGIFLGGVIVFVFCSLTLKAVGQASYSVVGEVRRQFQDEKVLQGEKEPEYEKCITLVTSSALKKMSMPSFIAVLTPVVIGFALGKQALGGLLIGSVVSGFLMAVMMANSGGAWDNAKKYIEQGNLGGKGSPTHKAAVIGDTVGDPFKDTAGPSLNILIKLMAIVSLIIAPLL
ncbi:sodium-translocating pyrophosphatase [bacterium]|nr:sodium-translocating pyrophosphatase [bacterium]